MDWQQWPSLPLTELAALPAQPGIYVVVDAEAQVWYVGLSRNLQARWNGGSGHHRYKQLSRTHKQRFYRIHWQVCPVEQLAAQERSYIDLFRPRLNYSPVKAYLRSAIQPHQKLSRIFKVINHKPRLFPDVRSVVLGYYRELDEDESGELKEHTCIVTVVNVNDHDRVILKSCQKSVTHKGLALKDCWFMFESNCGQSDPGFRPAMTPVFLSDELVYEFVCYYRLYDQLRQQRAGLCTVE